MRAVKIWIENICGVNVSPIKCISKSPKRIRMIIKIKSEFREMVNFFFLRLKRDNSLPFSAVYELDDDVNANGNYDDEVRQKSWVGVWASNPL